MFDTVTIATMQSWSCVKL